MKPTTLLILGTALLASVVFPSWGQETAPAGLRCVVFTVRDISSAGGARDYEQAITESIREAFSSRGYSVVPESAWKEAAAARGLDEDALVQSPEALSLAQSLGADLAVTGVFSVQQDEITYSLQCWQVATGRLASSAEQTTPFNLAFFSALSLELIDDLLPGLRPVSARPGERVVFTSPDEGMEVVLSGDLSIGRITNGRVSWPVDASSTGSRVRVEKRKNGFHRSFQVVTLTPGTEIRLTPLAPEHLNAVEVDWTVGQLLGAGVTARRYLVPDWFYISMGNYFFVQPPVTPAPRAVIHDDFSVGIGGYVMTPPEWPVRVGLSTGVGTIITDFTVPGFPAYYDIYLDVVNVWLEVRIAGVALFLRQEYRYSLGISDNLLGKGWLLNGFPPTTVGVLFPW